jgi:hypothetical protein
LHQTRAGSPIAGLPVVFGIPEDADATARVKRFSASSQLLSTSAGHGTKIVLEVVLTSILRQEVAENQGEA